MSELVFMGTKWQGAYPADLEFGDLVWVVKHAGHPVDRVIARHDLARRQREAKRRRGYGFTHTGGKLRAGYL